QQAVDSTVPRVTPMFWSFRIMVGLGFAFALLLTLSLYHTVRGTFLKQRWLLTWAVLFIPLPWVAAELGWFVAEYGRQPWTIYGVLPTHLSASSLSVGSLYGSLIGFIVFYTGLLVIELYLMFKYARKGPGSLGTGRYHADKAAH
ncbi:MAG TPA: cytochrome ubiquinol oxidase subunit I, partial [Gallionellaceae bacterium]